MTEEIPVVFECQGEQLVGIVHRPREPVSHAIVTVIAGGPQYRAGVARNMVEMARELSAQGVAVLRFDHRGLGDSSGPFLGFQHMEEDIQAAVNCLRQVVPAVREVTLWGGCDAASACMIHGWKIQGVASLVLGNPFVTTEGTRAAVVRQHYLQRLREWSFWRKLLRFEYDIGSYLAEAGAKLRSRLRARRGRSGSDAPVSPPSSSGASAGQAAAETGATGGSGDWIGEMRDGLHRFQGPVLFLMSGRSIVSREFDELVQRSRAWRSLYNRPGYRRIDLAEADQTFSGGDSRRRVNRALRDWVQELDAG